MEFLPNEGSVFDDQRPSSPLPTPAQLNSLALRMEINQRPGVAVYVCDQKQRQTMRAVLGEWHGKGEIHHPVDVWLDSSVEPGDVVVRYP